MEKLLGSVLHTARPEIAAAAQEALRLAGFGGRVTVEKTTSPKISVELVKGYVFELEQLLAINASFEKPRVFCIDGTIEAVSEIHHLLEAASSAKEPCVVFLRSASEEVKHTLTVNYNRGSLKVVLLAAKYDMDGMNTLVDLAIVLGCDLVSSLKGDLISSIKFEDAPRVDRVTFHSGKTTVFHAATHRRVAQHVADIQRRRSEHQLDVSQSLLDKRLKSLQPRQVVVRLPDTRDFVVNSQAIDTCLRQVKSLVDYGVSPNQTLAATELAAVVYAEKCVSQLNQLGAVLTQEV